MKNGVKGIPDGFHTITPHLIVHGATEAIDFYKRAFGARELGRHPEPGGTRLLHALLQIGSSRLMLADAFPEMGGCAQKTEGGSNVTINLYLEDADAVFAQAVAAGATVKMPMMSMFWGDRYGQITDPFGHDWALATHIEDVPPEELATRAQAAFAQMHGQKA
jgi:uncharacterized glyoxalase superfamily protein PhnB